MTGQPQPRPQFKPMTGRSYPVGSQWASLDQQPPRLLVQPPSLSHSLALAFIFQASYPNLSTIAN